MLRSRPSVRLVACLTALVVLLVAGLATAQAQNFGRNKVVYDDFDFERLQTEHFDVYYYPPMEPAAQDAARMAERWYTRLSQVFQHEFTDRTPIILYADDTDFQQTNVIGGFIGEGTGGVTEGGRQRLIMPLTGSYDETDRILGHEMVHVFQYDLWKENPRAFQLGALPLWFIEGTAEYLSQGRTDPHTAMWMRDALRNEDVPTTRQLTREQNRYFPYRYGQALMAYIGGNWGDQTLGILYRRAGYAGLETAFQEVLGVTGDELSTAWAEALRSAYGSQMTDRTALGSVEVRVPVLGSREFGLVSFPYLPTELVAFADGGVAWSSDAPPVFEFTRESEERIPVFSTGLSARVNVLGFLVVELMGVYPFQRPDKGWHFDFQISPGW